MAILLKDVAKQAGTSPATVSQVLNGRRSTIRVGESTRRRVLQVAKALGYRANPMARSLRTRRTATIGVVVHGVATNAPRIETAERFAGQHGYQLLLAVTRWEAEQEEDAIRRLLHRQVDGMMLVSPAIDAAERRVIEELVQEDFPLVAIGPPPIRECAYVDWDRRESYQQLAEHLLERGCRRLLFHRHEATVGVRQRIEGVQAAIKRIGGAEAELRIVGSDEAVLLGDSATKDRAIEQTRQFLRDGWPQAIITCTDEQALVVMQLCREFGLVVPRDVAVTGCSNASFTQYLDVPITTIRLPHERLVQEALAYLIRRIERDDEDAPVEQIQQIYPAELLLRQSSAFPPPAA